MPEPILGNYIVESKLGVLYRIVTKPAPLALVLNWTAVRGK
jgi:hypothetical protein